MNFNSIKKFYFKGEPLSKILRGGYLVWSGLKTWKKYYVVDEEYYKMGEIKYETHQSNWQSSHYTGVTAWNYWIVEYPSGKKIKKVVDPKDGREFKAGDYIVLDYFYKGHRNVRAEKIVSLSPTSSAYSAKAIDISLATRNIKGTFIEEVWAEEGTYPENGLHSDGYWYELVN